MVFFELKDLDYCIIIKQLTSVYTEVISHEEIGRGLCQVNTVSEKLEYLTNAESDADMEIQKQLKANTHTKAIYKTLKQIDEFDDQQEFARCKLSHHEVVTQAREQVLIQREVSEATLCCKSL